MLTSNRLHARVRACEQNLHLKHTHHLAGSHSYASAQTLGAPQRTLHSTPMSSSCTSEGHGHQVTAQRHACLTKASVQQTASIMEHLLELNALLPDQRDGLTSSRRSFLSTPAGYKPAVWADHRNQRFWQRISKVHAEVL